MKKNLLLLLAIPFLAGCSLFGPQDNPKKDDDSGESGGEGEGGGGGGQEDKDDPMFEDQEAIYSAFWKYTSKIEVELRFTNQAIFKFAEYGDPNKGFAKNEMYHPCDAKITIDGKSKVYKNVGARMKGNTSRNSSFVTSDGKFNHNSNRWAHFKLSFATAFTKSDTNDYYTETLTDEEKTARKDRRFGEMKKIDFKWNKNYDNSYTKEAYADDCLRSEGLIVQHTNLVKFTVKSESDSFTDTFLALETVDKPMLKRFLSKKEAGGDLYKCSWPVDLKESDSIGEESAEWCPKYQIKTNEDETDHSTLKNFLKVINEKGDAETAKTKLEEVMDLDYFAKYCAMMWVIGNPDDMRLNDNNSYLYFNGVSKEFIPIPYDNDRCFGILKDWDADTSNIPFYSTKHVDRSWIDNSLLWRTIVTESTDEVNYSDDYPMIDSVREAYYNYCKEFAPKYLSKDKFQTFTNQFAWSNKDISKGGENNLSFETYASNKLATLDA